jgi:hypothetical protein
MSPATPAASLPIRLGRGVVAVLSSFGTCVVILLLLLLLTYLGTLEQQFDNLYNVQQRYFESLFVSGPLGIPLPGAYLLLAALFVNLLVGGIVRLRKTWSRAGIFVTHLGMALLLLGGFVEFQASTKGYLALHEQEPFTDADGDGRYTPGERFEDLDGDGRFTPGQIGDRYESYYEWDLTITPATAGVRRQAVLPHEALARSTSTPVRFTGGDLPFDVEVRGWTPNARVVRVAPGQGYGVDGLALQALDEHPEKKENNRPGLYVRLLPRAGGEPVQCIAWSAELAPFRAVVGGAPFDVALEKRTWALPFKVRLDTFVHRLHPGTGMAREYSSHITKIENDVPEGRHITMNEPLRHQGHTLYQASFGEEATAIGARRNVSVFAVVRNPADRIPLIACLIIFAGLLWHFGRRLLNYLRGEKRRAQR